MRSLIRIVNAVADTCFAWFTPLWRRRGHEAAGQLKWYINHYRPTIKPEMMDELVRMRAQLREALLHWRRAEVEELVGETREKFERTPMFHRNVLGEVIESLFVITVVFLGIRTYFVQPFRIPTNSMWPSLNGIVVHPLEGEMPSLPKRLWDKLTLGSTYVDEKADKRKTIVKVKEDRSLLLFTETILEFDDGSKVVIPSARGSVMQYLYETGKAVDTVMGLHFVPYEPGETIMRARIDAGDMVLVNRMAYHFRAPKRGETFVFDTRGINTESSTMKEQSGGTHFIKRLCGLPGDTLTISSPHVMINGAPATEPGMARVASARPPYSERGYVALSPRVRKTPYLPEGRTVKLGQGTPEQPWMSEYVALGDNTENSLDSRYWGTVKQFNILGPASFTLWPFTAHWGSID